MHKIADKWSQETYSVVSQPNSDILVYEVKPEVGRGRIKVLHRNLLRMTVLLLLQLSKCTRYFFCSGPRMEFTRTNRSYSGELSESASAEEQLEGESSTGSEDSISSEGERDDATTVAEQKEDSAIRVPHRSTQLRSKAHLRPDFVYNMSHSARGKESKDTVRKVEFLKSELELF